MKSPFAVYFLISQSKYILFFHIEKYLLKVLSILWLEGERQTNKSLNSKETKIWNLEMLNFNNRVTRGTDAY